MKKNRLYLAAAALAVLVSTSCKDNEFETKSPFDNVVYLNVAESHDTQAVTFKKTLSNLQKEFSAVLSYPASEPITVSVGVDPSLVETYNARHNTSWPMLEASHYLLSEDVVTISAGKTISPVVTLDLKGLDGPHGLDIDATYLLPVTISEVQGGVDMLHSSSTVYYLVKRSSAITTAASLRDNWINFPTLDKDRPETDIYNGLTAVTYEAIIRVDDFTKHSEISTIMGIEDNLLLRIGDAAFPRQQIQIDGSGGGEKSPAFGKFPKKDDSKLLDGGKWYHIAMTFDQATRIVRIYVNGKLQSEGVNMGPSVTKPFNLALRSFYDKYLKDPEKWKDYASYNEARQFFLGKSYDDSRQLNGDIAEVRVWSVARTAEEIWKCMYDVENPATQPGLLGYWKFDEGKGNVIKDWSGHGNDAVAEKDLVWPEGIEIPQINKDE